VHPPHVEGHERAPTVVAEDLLVRVRRQVVVREVGCS